ncbi:MAG: phosphoribosyltransferase family protein [Bacteroidota bacterium]
MQIVLNHTQIQQKISRIAHEIIENTFDEKKIFIAGICGNGFLIAKEIQEIIKTNSEIETSIFEISLDKENPLSSEIKASFDISSFKNEYLILVDDVVNSGKTMQYALTKILENPTKNIKTVALVDRTHRRFPIKCDYVGLTLSTTIKNRVEVDFTTQESFAYLI